MLDWSPDSREVEGDADRAQVWKSPSYGKLDLHLSYKLPEIAGLDMTLSGHIFNALDNVYVQDVVTIVNTMGMVIKFTLLITLKFFWVHQEVST